MPAPKRPATKPAVAKKSPTAKKAPVAKKSLVARKPLAAKQASLAKKPAVMKKVSVLPFMDPLVELFGRAVAAAQERRWREAAVLFRRLLHDTGDDPGLGESARRYLALCEQRLGNGRVSKANESEDDPYLQAVFEKNRGDFAAALALCRRGGRHRRDERMAYLAASILALKGELVEAAELLALAVGQNPKNRVQAFHDSDFAEVLGRAEFAFVLDPS